MKQFEYKYELSSNQRKKYVEEYINEIGVENIKLKSLVRMYDYIVYQLEKETNGRKSNIKGIDAVHFNALVDNMNGIKTRIKPERPRKTPKKAIKYAIIDNDKILLNKMRNENYTYKKTIEQNIIDYQLLKNKIKNDLNAKDELRKAGFNTSLSTIIGEVNADISYCREGLIVNNVFISESMRSKYDKLKDSVVDYSDKVLVKAILKNFRLIEQTSKNKPFDTLHCVYLDFKKAHEEIILTPKQTAIRDYVLSGNILQDGDRASWECLVKNYIKYFQQNKLK